MTAVSISLPCHPRQEKARKKFLQIFRGKNIKMEKGAVDYGLDEPVLSQVVN
jgi:hypothetical protein